MRGTVRAIYRIEPGPDGPAWARRIVDRECSGLVSRITLEELELMISELVTNGMRYGAEKEDAAIFIDLRVEDTIRCVVSGAGLGFMLDGQPGEAGRWGLRVLDWLAERWGVTRADDETQIWFELAPA